MKTKEYDLVALGEAVVEIFRVEADLPLWQAGTFAGPFPSGAPAISADTMAKLGGKAALMGTIGEDDFGKCIRERLRRDGVDTSALHTVSNGMTGVAFNFQPANGDRQFIYNFLTSAPAQFSPSHLDEEIIRNAKWLHISGNVLAFSQSARQAIFRACEIAAEAGTNISLDPNIRPEIMKKEELAGLFEPVFKRAKLVIPSEGELSAICSGMDETAAVEMLLERGVELVALKKGENGCELRTRRETLKIPAPRKISCVDTTGCGDAFCAALIYGLIQKWNLARCGLFANAVGAITALHKGAMEGVTSLADATNWLNEGPKTTFGG